ncbi:MAG: hypothetical protein AAFU61_02675 [Pseudomonadota bacterium]
MILRGWFQCRLASDPDPTDEPRGISGCTFATVGEPDFDRVLRLQPEGTTPRRFGQSVGVRVSAVRGRGAAQAQAEAALRGARVNLPGRTMFTEQNGALVPRNTAFIDPFDLCIENADGAPLLYRAAFWDPARPELSAYDVPAATLATRQPRRLDVASADKVAAASGTGPPGQMLERRRRDLAQAKAEAETGGDRVAAAAFQQRLEALELTDWRAQRLHMLLSARAWWRFHLNGREATVSSALPALDAAPPWRLALWLGAWDNDTLCGYLMGRLVVPEAAAADAAAVPAEA